MMNFRSANSQRQRQRQEQITNLKSIVPGTIQTSNDESQFEVPIPVAAGQLVKMRVFLPSNFPDEKPVLQMLSQIRHPWLNTFFQVTGHPQLQSWNPECSLATIVLDVIDQFAAGSQSQPSAYMASNPFGSPTSQPSQQQQQAPRQYSSANPFSNPNPDSSPPPDNPAPLERSASRRTSHHTPMPPIPSSFPELENAPITQLNRLLNDDVAFDAFFCAMGPVLNFKALHRDLLKGNAELAKSNMEEGEKQEASYAEILALQATLSELKSSYRGKLEEHGLYEDSSDLVLEKVKHATKQAENVTEELAQNFEGGTYSEDQLELFIGNFLENRCRYHQLAAKVEHAR
mmetsp:Transcript_28641/g.37533  ORF Transcript_28641/g.37533 Transcript_28641/m.37533 type:complete len:345 (-) Transcript_28641:194-1228(-)